MSTDSWTHAICVSCWTAKHPDRDPAARMNARGLSEFGVDDCCYCGKPASEGIYVRDNPQVVHGRIVA